MQKSSQHGVIHGDAKPGRWIPTRRGIEAQVATLDRAWAKVVALLHVINVRRRANTGGRCCSIQQRVDAPQIGRGHVLRRTVLVLGGVLPHGICQQCHKRRHHGRGGRRAVGKHHRPAVGGVEGDHRKAVRGRRHIRNSPPLQPEPLRVRTPERAVVWIHGATGIVAGVRPLIGVPPRLNGVVLVRWPLPQRGKTAAAGDAGGGHRKRGGQVARLTHALRAVHGGAVKHGAAHARHDRRGAGPTGSQTTARDAGSAEVAGTGNDAGTASRQGAQCHLVLTLVGRPSSLALVERLAVRRGDAHNLGHWIQQVHFLERRSPRGCCRHTHGA